MRNLKLNYNTLYVIKSELEFPVKGFGTTPRDSSKLRVEVLYKALLVQHKCGHTQLYLAYEYVQYKEMQDIREIELRDSGSNANNKVCFEIRATTLHPRLHAEGFPVCPHRTFHKGSSTEELQLYTWSTLLISQTQSPLHNRDRHKI